MTLFHGSHPPWLRLMGVRTSYIHFLIFSGHLEFWTPLQVLSWGPPLGCTLLQSLLSDLQPLYNHIKDNGRRSRLLVTASGWKWTSYYLTLGQWYPERGCSTEGALPVRGRTSQNPSQLAVTAKLQARCPKAGITGQLASLSYSGGERFGKRVGRHN